MMRAQRHLRQRRGVTLVELLIASVIGVLITGGVTALLITMARQTRVNFAQEVARRHAAHVLDRMARELRSASVNEAVSFEYATELASGIYDSVRFTRYDQTASQWVIGEFRLSDGAVIFDPNVAVSDNEETIARASVPGTDFTDARYIMPRITALRFIQNFDNTGVEDNTSLTVQMEVSDNGDTRRPWGAQDRTVGFMMSTFLTLRAPSPHAS